jgi:hypothetical protein
MGEMLQNLRAWSVVGDEAVMRADDILDGLGAYLGRLTLAGTDHAGAALRAVVLRLCVFGRDGQ